MKNRRSKIGLSILAGGLSFVGGASAIDIVVDGSYESSTNNLSGFIGTGGDDNAGIDNGWTSFATYTYSANYTQAGPDGSGQVYLRPYSPSQTVSQTNSLTRAITTAQIDGSQGQYTVSAWFSTYHGNNDYSDLTLQFLDTSLAPMGSPVALGGLAFVTGLAGGSGNRAWGQDARTGVVPPGARYAAIETVSHALVGSPDGYVDLVSLNVIVAPTPIQLVSASPATNAVNVPPGVVVNAVLRDGTPMLDNSSIQFKFDGSTVLPSVQKVGTDTTVQYDPPGLLSPLSSHSYQIAFNKDGGSVPNTTNIYPFTVGSYVDLILPAPIPGAFEDFNSTVEGALPAGWTAISLDGQRDPNSEPNINFTNLDSAAYTNWTVVEAYRFTNTFDTYSQLYNGQPQPPAEATDYQRVLSVNPFNVVNGAVVTNLATGRFAFGDSGYRNDALGQILYMFSRDFNVTGYSNVYLSFHSLWEQNQDSIGAVEYSIDMGTTWLPVVYMLDGPVIATNLDGSIDSLTTFTNVHSDVAQYVDINSQIVGGYYGAFIGVDSNLWSTLAPYISARVDDDRIGSKRVEIFRLPKADNQPKVRFRFAHAGTDSWYFGVDDLGLYSLPPLKINSIARNGANAVISWNGAAGTTLQKTTSLTSPGWQEVPGSNGASTANDPITGSATYYRLSRSY